MKFVIDSSSRSTIRGLFAKLRLALPHACLLLLASNLVNAADVETGWTVPGLPTVYSNKGTAVSAMQGISAKHALYTVENPPETTDNNETFTYKAPWKSPAPTTEWLYRTCCGTVDYSTESALWTQVEATARSGDSVHCSPATVTPTGGWYDNGGGFYGVSRAEKRDYHVDAFGWSETAHVCSASGYDGFVTRSREAGCPPYYSATATAPHCYIPTSANVVGKRQYTDKGPDCGCRGNPTNALTGDKHETIVDYSGPGGLTLVRHYHSRSLDETAKMGAGWSHNYHIKLSPIASGIRTGITRPDGNRESLYQIGGSLSNYITKSGSSLVLRKISTTDWRLYRRDGGVEMYDDDGRLLQLIDSAGRITQLAYTGSKLSTVTGPFGHQLQFVYGTGGLLATVILPGGDQIQYGYSGKNLVSVEYPDGGIKTYHYEDASQPNNLTGVSWEDGDRFSTFAYDGFGRATLSEHAGSVDRNTFVYNTANTVVTDPLGTTETISFTTSTSLERRVTQTSKASLVRAYTIPSAGTDSQRRVTQSTDARGFITKFTYDAYQMLSKTEAFGTPRARTTSYQYLQTDSALPTLITEPNRTTSFTYAGTKVLTRTVTDTAAVPNTSRTWTYSYNASGQVLTEDGPRTDASDVTTYSYYTCATGYQCGQLYTITNALGHTTTYNSYNAHAQPTQITDANGLVTGLAYDLRQRLTDRCVGSTLPVCAGGELTHLDYWPTGLLKKVTNPDGSFIEYTHDPAHRLTQINDGALNKIVYTLDNAGNRTGEKTYDPGNALRRTHTRVFNTLSQLWKDVNAAGTGNVTTTFAYDANSNPTTTSAPLSRNSTSFYDELNRLKQITDPASGITQFGYDANDNLTSVTDPRSLVTSYTYSGFGDLKTQTSPDTGLTTNTYDSGGNLDTSTDSRGAVTDFAYDAANRVTSASFTLSGVTDQVINYAYDTGTNQNGRLTSASDANHTLAWTYDTQGRVTGKGQTVGGVTLAMGYGYNAAGQLGNIVLPSGANIAFGYNTNGQVTSLTLNGSTTILNAITYDPFGPINGWTWGNATTASRAFDTDGKIFQVDNAAGASLKSYAYDDAFRITGISDAMDPTLSWTFGYDLLDRLNSASKTGTTQGWTYDANGNRLTETGTTPSTYTNSGTSNRVSAISGSLPRTYAYDATGNTLSYAGATFTYDNRGRMATATNAGVTASYIYNALWQRVSRTASGVTTLYAYDEGGHLAGEYTSAGAIIQETLWLGDIPVATLRPDGNGGVNVFYVHADHLNTPRLVTDTSNNIRWRWESDPFGITQPNENPSSLGVFAYSLRFPGQQYDAVVGLHYNYFRDYDPATGEYTQSDPIGLSGGVNTYGYVQRNPLNAIDTLGLTGATTVDSWCFQHPIPCAEMAGGRKAAARAAAAAASAAAAVTSDSRKCCTEYTLVYQGNPKHRLQRYYNNRGRSVARAPSNGESTLLISVPTDPSGDRRVGYDPTAGELVVFPRHQTDDVNCIKYYHGWVVDYQDDVYGRDDILKTIRDSKFPMPR